MTDIVAFLNARLDEDERVARAATAGPWEDHHGFVTDIGPTGYPYVQVTDFGTQDDEDAIENGRPQGAADSAHIARHDPARVLRDVAAKRALIQIYVRLTEQNNEHVRLAKEDPFSRHAAMKETSGVRVGVIQGVIEEMAAVYADHPDYNPTWATS